MKRYSKVIDGKSVIKLANEIIIRTATEQIINPLEQMILADGWKEYIIPKRVESFDEIKARKIEEIIAYDSSDAVNRFFVAGYPIWLDKLTRVGLKGRLDAEKAKGDTHTTLWYEHIQFYVPIEKAYKMLEEIELYASACYDNTQKHIAEVMKLDNTLAVEQYDYTSGYPEQLTFNENYSL